MKRAIQHIGMTLGWVAALALTAIVGMPSVAAQEGGGSISIYAFACPDGFDGGDYDTCRSLPLPGVGFTASEAGQDNGVGTTTDADGVASLALAAQAGGAVNVAVSPPAGYESAYVSCSQAYGATDAGISFAELAADAFVTCEWFFMPTSDQQPGADEDGSLTVYVLGCPVGFDGEDYGECEGRPLDGVSLTVAAAGQDNGVGGSTDPSGTAWFPLFAADLPGDVTVLLDLPDGYAGVASACWDATGAPVDSDDAGSGITLLRVASGADVSCAVYASPAASGHDGDSDGDAEEVTRLPNTGSGVTGDSSAGAVVWILLLGAGMVAMGATVASGRRA